MHVLSCFVFEMSACVIARRRTERIVPHVLMYCNEMPEEHIIRIQTYPYANFVQLLVDCVVQYGNEMLSVFFKLRVLHQQ